MERNGKQKDKQKKRIIKRKEKPNKNVKHMQTNALDIIGSTQLVFGAMRSSGISQNDQPCEKQWVGSFIFQQYKEKSDSGA